MESKATIVQNNFDMVGHTYLDEGTSFDAFFDYAADRAKLLPIENLDSGTLMGNVMGENFDTLLGY